MKQAEDSLFACSAGKMDFLVNGCKQLEQQKTHAPSRTTTCVWLEYSKPEYRIIIRNLVLILTIPDTEYM